MKNKRATSVNGDQAAIPNRKTINPGNNRTEWRGSMQRYIHWVFTTTVVGMLAIIPLAGCEKTEPESHAVHPATLEPVGNTGLTRITLTQQAADRLGVQMAVIAEQDGKLVAPYSALLYDADGGTWVYVNLQGLAFKREGVVVDRIDGETMYLSKGPSAGSKVASTGAAELFGAEFEIGH